MKNSLLNKLLFIPIQYSFVDLPFQIELVSLETESTCSKYQTIYLTFFYPEQQKGFTITLAVNYGVRVCAKIIDDGHQRLEFYCYSVSSVTLLKPIIVKVQTALIGQVQPFSCVVELRGLGYKVWVKRSLITGKNLLEFKLGLSHIVIIKLPNAISVQPLGLKNRALKLIGPDLQQLHAVRQQICGLRDPNIYKLKGIFSRFSRPRIKKGYKQTK